MEDLFRGLIPLLIVLALIWRFASGALRGRTSREGDAPAADESWADLQRRAEERRRQLEEVQQQMEWEAPPPPGPLELPYEPYEETPAFGSAAPPLEATPAAGPPAPPSEGPRPPAPAAEAPRKQSLGRRRHVASPAAALLNRRSLRQAVLVKEILGQPLGLRRREDTEP